jgi:hypothetical protein
MLDVRRGVGVVSFGVLCIEAGGVDKNIRRLSKG